MYSLGWLASTTSTHFTSAAIWQGSLASRAGSTLLQRATALSPRRSRDQLRCTPVPKGVTSPSPVTTTRRRRSILMLILIPPGPPEFTLQQATKD